MVKYSCERCGKEFSQKSHYDSHKRRKTPCENNADEIKLLVDKAVEEKLKELIENKSFDKINMDEETMSENNVVIKLPKTRFQGSKRKIINKIYDIMLANFDSKPKNILDLFGGSAICSLYFKLNNINVIYNDVLKFNSINAHGLLHNNIKDIPTSDEIQSIFTKDINLTYDTFISDTFKDIYYTDKENVELDIFRENIKHYRNKDKMNIMYYLLFQALISKRPYNLFHRKNLHMRTADVKRGFGNKVTWEKSFIVHMLKFRNELVDLYEQVQQNRCGNYNIINYSYNDISTEILSTIDTIYIDPPYFKKNCQNSQYFDQYHFLEGFVIGDWGSNIDHSTKHLKLKTSEKNIITSATEMFENIIKKYRNKNLVISYNRDAFPKISDIENLLKKVYKRVITRYIDYNYALSKKSSKEVLILALVA